MLTGPGRTDHVKMRTGGRARASEGPPLRGGRCLRRGNYLTWRNGRNDERPLLAVAAASVDGERTVLETFLNFHRATIVRKVRGLSEEDARLRRVPS
nr:hypothetical protein GCM10020093_043690 [Planobispora longispora]